MKSTTFGDALRAERRRLEITQTDLAKQLDTSQQNVAAWESGRLPRTEYFEKLLEVFGPHSPIAGLPARGEIPGSTEILQANEAICDVEQSRRNTTTHRLTEPIASQQAAAIGVLFDALPADLAVRNAVFHQVARVIIAAGQ